MNIIHYIKFNMPKVPHVDIVWCCTGIILYARNYFYDLFTSESTVSVTNNCTMQWSKQGMSYPYIYFFS